MSESDGRPVAKRKVSISKSYKDVFSSPEGRRVLVDLMKRAGILTMADGGTTEDLLYKTGRRDMVLEILGQLRFNEERLLELSQAAEEQPLDLVFN